MKTRRSLIFTGLGLAAVLVVVLLLVFNLPSLLRSSNNVDLDSLGATLTNQVGQLQEEEILGNKSSDSESTEPSLIPETLRDQIITYGTMSSEPDGLEYSSPNTTLDSGPEVLKTYLNGDPKEVQYVLLMKYTTTAKVPSSTDTGDEVITEEMIPVTLTLDQEGEVISSDFVGLP